MTILSLCVLGCASSLPTTAPEPTTASVAFGIHFIRVADGRLIWVGHFDETQHSLSKNLFKLATFVRRGGGWLTAEQLATFGLRETMATIALP